MNRLLTLTNPFTDESWNILSMRFHNEFSATREYDVNDPGSWLDVLDEEVASLSQIKTVDTAKAALGALWLGQALMDRAPQVWVAGWNMPGYLPEMEPTSFLDRTSAAGFIAEEINSRISQWYLAHADDTEQVEFPYTPTKLHEVIMLTVNARGLKAGDEIGIEIDGTYFWLRRRTMSEAMGDPDFEA